MKALILAAAAAASTYAFAPQSAPAQPLAEPSLEEVRAGVERFRDVNVALAEGYIPAPDSMCETATHMGQPAELGAMGIHYFRPDLLGITAPPTIPASTAAAPTPTSASRRS